MVRWNVEDMEAPAADVAADVVVVAAAAAVDDLFRDLKAPLA